MRPRSCQHLRKFVIFFIEGGHLGRDKTIEKICSRFFWKNMTEDIKDFVKRCPKCQTMNASFNKSNAVLHPVPVEPDVWKQVCQGVWKELAVITRKWW